MKLIKFFLIIFLCQTALAQKNKPFYKTYDWDKNPTYSVEAADSDEKAIEIMNKYVNEFAFEGNNFVEYALEHHVVWLNSDEKIEEYNRIYLPFSATSQLEKNKARVITKDGKIHELDKSSILTAEDEETGRQYKYYAFEGIEKGSFIEYFYVVKKVPTYGGKRLALQSDVKKRNVTFDLYAPGNLVFTFKSYNGIPEVVLDTISKDEERFHWQLKIDKLEDIPYEEMAPYNAEVGFLIYKLDQNLASNASDISSYGNVAQNIFEYYYAEVSKRTEKELDDFINEVIGDAKSNEESAVRKLESHLKTNFVLTGGGNEDLEDISKILDQKITNETGLIKLYVAVLKQLDIEHEIVLTSDRMELKFDKNFEANNFLTDFLIYLPKSDKYFSPVDNGSRIGFPPAYLTDNYGLFIKQVKVGNFVSAVGEIKYINPVSNDESNDNSIIHVKFNEDMESVNVKLDKALSGYYASFIQPYSHLISDKDKDEFLETVGKRINENVEIVSKEMKNAKSELFGVEPIHFILEVNSDALIEKAGNKYLFKMGELIGQQMQLYQEKERVLPLETEFQRSYYRTITIEIPEGYQIVNLDDINLKNVYSKDGKEMLSFDSHYEVENNILTITADEHYKMNIMDTEIYDEYRKVINSAADFNKITLVFEPI
ncbi:MAG TPA: DUF3857 domain-containing protein [Salinimicrobium sp.]|nr:DUF3857 domain-containing protein [Salinimicrobium sp.]